MWRCRRPMHRRRDRCVAGCTDSDVRLSVFASRAVGRARAVTAVRRLRGERPHRAEACARLDGHGSVVPKGGVAPPLVVSLSTTERWQKTPPRARKTRAPGPARGPATGLPRFGYAGPSCQARQRAELLVAVRNFMDDELRGLRRQRLILGTLSSVSETVSSIRRS